MPHLTPIVSAPIPYSSEKGAAHRLRVRLGEHSVPKLLPPLQVVRRPVPRLWPAACPRLLDALCYHGALRVGAGPAELSRALPSCVEVCRVG